MGVCKRVLIIEITGQPRRYLDAALAKKEFGFAVKTALETGPRKTIQWYKTYGQK